MNPEETKIEREAEAFIKSRKGELIKKFADLELYNRLTITLNAYILKMSY